MIQVEYTKPLSNNTNVDVADIKESYLADLQKLRDYYGPLIVQATFNSRSHLRRVM